MPFIYMLMPVLGSEIELTPIIVALIAATGVVLGGILVYVLQILTGETETKVAQSAMETARNAIKMYSELQADFQMENESHRAEIGKIKKDNADAIEKFRTEYSNQFQHVENEKRNMQKQIDIQADEIREQSRKITEQQKTIVRQAEDITKLKKKTGQLPDQ